MSRPSQPPSTVISGHLDTNFLTLWDGYGIPARIRFGDETEQQTAFTNTMRSNLDTMKYHTRNINYYDFGYNTTQITGRLVTNNFLIDGGSVTYSDATVQNSAFTNTLKTNVENMKSNTRNVIYYNDGFDTTQIGGRIVTNNLRLYNGNIGFSDGTFQNSAFTNELNSLYIILIAGFQLLLMDAAKMPDWLRSKLFYFKYLV
jgi:hypothetical protein